MESFELKQANLLSLIAKHSGQSKEQLAATTFIKEVIGSVQSIEDFLHFKSDMLEALNDTENGLLAFIDDADRVLHERDEQKRGEDILKKDMGVINNQPKQELDVNSASLGLRFNYESYLNKEKNDKAYEDQKQFNPKQVVSQTEQQLFKLQMLPHNHKEERGLNFDYSSSNNSIDVNSMYSKDKEKAKEKPLQLQEHKEPIPSSQKMNNPNIHYDFTFNSAYNKLNPIDSRSEGNMQKPLNSTKDNNSIAIANMSNSQIQPIQEYTQPIFIENNQKSNELLPNDPIQNSALIKKKASRLADLITKIQSEQEIYEIIVQLFGEDIMTNLFSSKISDEFIDDVEKSVNEIERLKQKDLIEERINSQESLTPNLNAKAQSLMNDELFYETPINNYRPIPIQKNSIKRESNDRCSKTYSNIQTNKGLSFSDELLIANGLIQSNPSTSKEFSDKGSINNQSGINQVKIPLRTQYKKVSNPIPPVSNFVNYTSPHGNYFDSSLQNGGITKIKTLKTKKPNKAISPVREYIRSIHQLTSNSLNQRRIGNR